jgi:hypothetical protein
MSRRKERIVHVPSSAADAGRSLELFELILATMQMPYVRNVMENHARGTVDFPQMAKSIDEAMNAQAAISCLYDTPDQAKRYLSLVLNLPALFLDHGYKALWRVASRRGWKQRYIRDLSAYVRRAIISELRRIRSEERRVRGPELAPVEATEYYIPSPDQIVAAQEMLEAIRVSSTDSERQIVDLLVDRDLNEKDDRKGVAATLRKHPDNLRKQISNLKKKRR